jgi:RNA polymerase sigma-70 factor (ECF subfamily)
MVVLSYGGIEPGVVARTSGMKGASVAALHAADRKLAERMLAGEEAAFEAFFDRHFPGLHYWALPRLDHDPADAQDAAQATICIAISKLHTYRGEAALFTWLCAICGHEIGRIRRHKARTPQTLEDPSPEIMAALEVISRSDPDHPQTSLERAELVRSVQATLDGLPEHYRLALTLKYLEAVPVREIARRLDLQEKAAESLLTRAREAFRKGFAAICGSNVRGSAEETTGDMP